MNSVNMTLSGVLSGYCQGTSTDASLYHKINVREVSTYTQGGTGATLINQLIDHASTSTTLAAAATSTIDLTTGQTNPLGESISSTDAFAKLRILIVVHESTSVASSITVFNAAANAFQGSLSAAATITLKPGEFCILCSPTTAGWTIDATHKNVKFLNNDGANTATYSYFIGGSKS